MQHTQKQQADLIDLGPARAATKGLVGKIPDWAAGQDPMTLSDD